MYVVEELHLFAVSSGGLSAISLFSRLPATWVGGEFIFLGPRLIGVLGTP